MALLWRHEAESLARPAVELGCVGSASATGPMCSRFWRRAGSR